MKGLMVPLLVLMMTGTVFGQQFQSGSSSRNNQGSTSSSSRSNRNSLAPLSGGSASVRPARTAALPTTFQSGQTDRGGSQSIQNRRSDREIDRPVFGPQPNPNTDGGSSSTNIGRRPIAAGSNNLNSGFSTRSSSATSNPSLSSVNSNQVGPTASGQNFATRSNSQPARSYRLLLDSGSERKLRSDGFIPPFPIPSEAIPFIKDVLLYGNEDAIASSSANITDDQIQVLGDMVVIDVDDFHLDKIKIGTFSLRDFGNYGVNKIALRYINSNHQRLSNSQFLNAVQRVTGQNPTPNGNPVTSFPRQNTNLSAPGGATGNAGASGSWRMPGGNNAGRRTSTFATNRQALPSSAEVPGDRFARTSNQNGNNYLNQVSQFNQQQPYSNTSPQQVYPDNRPAGPGFSGRDNRVATLPMVNDFRPTAAQVQYQQNLQQEQQMEIENLKKQIAVLSQPPAVQQPVATQAPMTNQRFADLRAKYYQNNMRNESMPVTVPTSRSSIAEDPEFIRLQQDIRDREEKIAEKQKLLEISQAQAIAENRLDRGLDRMKSLSPPDNDRQLPLRMASLERQPFRGGESMANGPRPTPALREYSDSRRRASEPQTVFDDPANERTSAGGGNNMLLLALTFLFGAACLYLGLSLKAANDRFGELAAELRETFSSTI